MILHFHIIANMGFWLLVQIGDDGKGPADESKRTKRVQGWSHQIMEGAFIICNTIAL